MATRTFPEIKKHLGFGMMRLPMKGEEMDTDRISEMVDAFIAGGFNYFDTAHGYHKGMSETAIKASLTSRHDRSEYLLTNKLTDAFFNTEEEIRPLFESQLEACGVDYFDFYLLHSVHAKNFDHYKKTRAYETVLDLKKEGKVRHIGFSFHDKAEVLDRILNEWPEIEIVQIQFNYFDYEDLVVESRKVYEVARKHGKPVLVMEPVRGGNLVNLPEKAQALFDNLRAETGSTASNASYAVRFAATFEGMEVVLSGMSNMDQLNDNMSFMKDFEPLSDKEMETCLKAADEFRNLGAIPCTSCRYCIEENQCPMDIRIPAMFTLYNKKLMFNKLNSWESYEDITKEHGMASDCIKCGMCEGVCPQHIEIREKLTKVAEIFE